MTIKAQTTFKIPHVEGEFIWTRNLRNGSRISALNDMNHREEIHIVDDGKDKFVRVFEDGYERRFPYEYISQFMQGSRRTRFGEIKILYEPALPSQARK